MVDNFKLTTEGVLIIASSNSLKRKYENEEFEYDFPDGINPLMMDNSIIAITNSGGDNLLVNFLLEKHIDVTKFDKVIEQSIELSEIDELLILSHTDFTMICSKDGNYKNEKCWPIKFSNPIEKGKYLVQIAIIDVEEDFEKYNAYFKVTINLIKKTEQLTPNFVCELCE
ncbi:hypothetical protein H0I23_08175 [Cellulophaga sp. HaHaR_3_176]|uniref:hypothetical protein n=1 Tax=Cellulophaga sp. HaHaR_3_176 TaxID=1942464 RepID=UPI001C1F4223|nr:hypothetical protein [Cellulophaga sp. HaHaR_3_176]QWX85603.1 hypothetical protein H0I23_08175 [Cellulophaga sp. HaHaR_3_176]